MASPRTNLLAPVHRAVEVAFLANFLPADDGFGLRDDSRVSNRVDRICLPGIASKVKRALTSEMRPAPLVITTKLMITSTVNTTMPTA